MDLEEIVAMFAILRGRWRQVRLTRLLFAILLYLVVREERLSD
jgi:hypothetical protein